MGKIVKYCAACEEGFAEKFEFCPNCGAHLTAFEMNPVETERKTETVETNEVEATAPAVTVFETLPKIEPATVAETQSFSADEPQSEVAETKEFFEFEDEVFQEAAVEEPKAVAAETSSNGHSDENLYEATYKKATDSFQTESKPYYVPDNAYHVTVVEEKNVKQRNLLLLGWFIFASLLFGGGMIYSVFNKYLDIAAIESPDLLAYVGEVDPTTMEPDEELKKDDNKSGGGGGGREDEKPVSKGREANQSDNPMFSPSVTYDRVTNPSIPIEPTTLGDKKVPNTDEPYGLRNSTSTDPSDGGGCCGGQGDGKGRGQGNDEGDGLGPGKNGGSGGGGNGPIGGRTDPNDNPDNIKVKKGETVALKILLKPRASYTDAARQNQVTGTVVLKVTFLASGQIGSISPVKGLPNGLTEQAIAAARGIRFEPAKTNGVPKSITKTIEYSFTIY